MNRRRRRLVAGVYALLIVPWLLVAADSAQTSTASLRNSYTPDEEVRRGREAAAGIRALLPTLGAPDVVGFVRDIGRRLVEAIPAGLKQESFQYSFDVVNVTDLVSYALSGGPVFVSRGMIETAPGEAAFAGLLAHQLSHVVLRHGAAQATSGETFETADFAAQTPGAIAARSVYALGLPGAIFGVSTYYVEYDSALEREADRLGRQLMEHAGYDPRQMAVMFRTIAQSSTDRGGASWIESHPDPGDSGRDVGPDGDLGRQVNGMAQVTARLRALAPAETAEAAARARGSRFSSASVGGIDVVVPSGESRNVFVGGVLHMDVPANWRRLSGSSAVVFAPAGGLFESAGGLVAFTHGVQVGVARAPTGDLLRDTQALTQLFAQTQPQSQWSPLYSRITLGGRNGLTVVGSVVSALTKRFSYVSVSTTYLRSGRFLYIVGIAPRLETSRYRDAFNRIEQSIRFID